MGLETATFIDDLVITNPISSDKKKQGDDHLRLIKEVLKNSIKNVTRAFYMPSAVTKSANYTVLSTDDNMTIVCDTTSAFTLTLPSLVSGDKGWGIWVLKTTTDANPVYVAPPSGTINGYTKVRRSVPFQPTRVTWTGTAFYAERANGSPIGSVIPYYGTTLPPGHLWPDGTTFTAADYVELNVVLGGNTKPDIRGRVEAGKDDMGGSSANRLTVLLDGDVLGATGGDEEIVLTQDNLPSIDLETTIASGQGSHTHVLTNGFPVTSSSPAGGSFPATGTSLAGTSIANATLPEMDGTTPLGGSDETVDVLQPTIIANKILVAE